MTFAEKLKLQENQSSEEVPEQVQEQVEELAQVRPKKARTRKPREKKVVEVVPEVEGGAVEVPKKERKPRKKKGEDVVEGGSVEPESKPEKEKRPPSAYNLFVKDAYKSKEVQKLPPKERFAKVAELWHKQKGKSGK
jgi:hypothetical protein